VKSGLLLNVVIRKSAAVLELLAGEDQTLLIRGDSLYYTNNLLMMWMDNTTNTNPYLESSA
jgi:hypothetical protein